ncbi:cytochrome c biogenesis protein DipZ, partial [Candidatus Peregrinibacteria bacterium]|nr:cytochrome c biogenesis protein DipZ [Candidatus Peregrinibacteria bacterium]
MILLVSFAFLAGVVTILSPCILPLLPIILSSSATGSKRTPFGVVVGFILSFTFFTLFLTTLVRLTGLSPDFLRGVAVAVILGFGLVLVVP